MRKGETLLSVEIIAFLLLQFLWATPRDIPYSIRHSQISAITSELNNSSLEVTCFLEFQSQH